MTHQTGDTIMKGLLEFLDKHDIEHTVGGDSVIARDIQTTNHTI